jgi:hypothetical protein
MKNSHIYFNKIQQQRMLELLEKIAFDAKNQYQGNCTIHEDYFDRIKEINPSITSVSANYYDCDGRIAFALKLTDRYENCINFDGNISKGFAWGNPRGHLEKYIRLRW